MLTTGVNNESGITISRKQIIVQRYKINYFYLENSRKKNIYKCNYAIFVSYFKSYLSLENQDK